MAETSWLAARVRFGAYQLQAWVRAIRGSCYRDGCWARFRASALYVFGINYWNRVLDILSAILVDAQYGFKGKDN